MKFLLSLAAVAVATSTASAAAMTSGSSVDNIDVQKPSPPQIIPSWRRRQSKHLRPVLEKKVKRDSMMPASPEPTENGLGGVEEEGQNIPIELQNPDGLNPPPTDGGNVVNLKWSFGLSNMLLNKGGYIREQLASDLPTSSEFAGAQNHLAKGAIRQMHWHSLDEWGYVTNGTVLVAVMDHKGRNQIFNATAGDIWYFPKGEPHAIQGLEDENEYLLIFDGGNFAAEGVTFNVDDWILHTPSEVLAKNFGFPVNSTYFNNTPNPFGSINRGTPSNGQVGSPFGMLTGNASWYFPSSRMQAMVAPGGGGIYKRVDSTNFPISQNIVAQIVELKPRAIREMHWHPNGAEWLYFQHGSARATVWLGSNNARTFDFTEGDTAIFPDNSGHYVENLSYTETLTYLEVFHSNVVEDVSLQQWLALTPPDLVAQVLNVSVPFLEKLKTEKQVLVAAQSA